MARYVQRDCVECPPGEAWALIRDVERWPEWCPTMRVVSVRAPEMAVGVSVYIEQPWLRPAVWRVCEWKPPVSFAWETTQAGLRILGRHRVAPAPTGCEVESTLQFTGLLPVLSGPLLGALARHFLRREASAFRAECATRRSAIASPDSVGSDRIGGAR
jgi:hypothetical protein